MANLNVDGDAKLKNLSGADPLTVAGLKVSANTDPTPKNYLAFTNADGNTLWGNFSADSAGALTWSGSLVGGLTLSTAQSVSGLGTSVNFTGIPSWVKRVTVMLNGVSTNGVSNLLMQVGSGSVVSTGYTSNVHTGNTNNSGTVTTGFILTATTLATTSYYGSVSVVLIGSNTYLESHSIGGTADYSSYGGGGVTLTGTLDRIRLTTVNGTDAFDAGSVNILYEG